MNMKYILPYLLALFPFLHEQKYEVQLTTCEKEHIVVEYQGTPMEVSLFNLQMKSEEGWGEACKLLNDAQKLSIEVDSTTKISEPLAVYMFADSKLLQEELVRSELAYTMIHNPEYKYEKQLLEIEEAQSTMSQLQGKRTADTYPSNGWKFLLCLFFCWSITLSYAVYKNKEILFKKRLDKS